MKKKIVIIISLLAILMIAACGTSPTASNNPSQTVENEGGTTDISTISKLVAGTFRLIESETPIAPQQAEELAVLWKAYNELQNRDTTAEQEKTDLLDQINSSFSADQQAAITAMNLSGQDVMAMVQELGLSTDQRRTKTNSQSSASATGGVPGGGGPGGGGPEGGAPPDITGGAGNNSSTTPSADELATIQARRADSGAQMETMTLLLIEPLITKLESVATSK